MSFVYEAHGGHADTVTSGSGECRETPARRLGLRMAELRDLDEVSEAAELLRRVWGASSSDQLINVGLMRALAYSGNYLVGAYRDDNLIGCSVAFFGLNHLHSHVLGVDPADQNKGVGFALKQHQRSWALQRGITVVRWTFDPLVRRNAHFNLNKLGARVTGYVQDFYGDIDDGINSGEATDRLLVEWELTPAPATAAASPGHCEPVKAVGPSGQINNQVVIPLPPDIESLRSRDRREATRWRYQVRQALTDALGRGYQVVALSDDGSYILMRDQNRLS